MIRQSSCFKGRRPNNLYDLKKDISTPLFIGKYSINSSLIWIEPPKEQYMKTDKSILNKSLPKFEYVFQKPISSNESKSTDQQFHIQKLLLFDIPPSPNFCPPPKDPSRASFSKIMNTLQTITDPELIFVYSSPSPTYEQYQLVKLFYPPPSEFSNCKEKDRIKGEGAKLISRQGFLNFQLGGFTNRVHIFAWHNLNFNPNDIYSALAETTNKFLNSSSSERDSDKLQCIVSYLMVWIHWFPADFSSNPKLSDYLIVMIDHICMVSDPSLKVGAYFVKAFLYILKESLQTPECFSIPLTESTFRDTNNSYSIMDFNIDPSLLALHIMYDELSDFRKLQVSEFMHGNWMNSKSRQELSPNCVNLTNNFNRRSTFIRFSILTRPTDKEKANAIEYWISVAIAAEKIRDFQLIFEIDGALCHPMINSLKPAWKLISKSATSQRAHISEMTQPTKQKRNQLRELENIDPNNTLPFLGHSLDSLNVLSENSKREELVPNGSVGINMHIQKKYLDEIDFIFAKWASNVEFNLERSLLVEVQKMSSFGLSQK